MEIFLFSLLAEIYLYLYKNKMADYTYPSKLYIKSEEVNQLGSGIDLSLPDVLTLKIKLYHKVRYDEKCYSVLKHNSWGKSIKSI